MATVRPFTGLRAAEALAEKVLAPPYDVVSEAEARAIVVDNPISFLRVTRSEVDLPEGSDSHGPEAYHQAAATLRRYAAEGVLVRDTKPSFYVYAQQMGEHRQAGLMALCSCAEYDQGIVRKHEFTRPDKEQDRTEHILALKAQTGLVFLAHRQTDAIAALHVAAADKAPLFTVTTPDGVVHSLTRVDDDPSIAAWEAAFAELPVIYIADGHHRSAAASNASAKHGGAGSWGHFLCGIFPDDRLQVLAYNRLVGDLQGRTPAEFLAALETDFHVARGVAASPERRGCFHMYVDGAWHSLTPRDGVVDASDPVASLDVAVLQDRVLEPLLGIADPRRDTRVRFVGGIRGTGALSAAVDAGEAAVAFSLFPTGLDQLFSVADAGEVMPPKSTWFEPKLAGGVLVHKLD
jgi:uncharacterized protein (DUF1015 family)